MGEERGPRTRMRIAVVIMLLALGIGALVAAGSLKESGGAKPAAPIAVQRENADLTRVADVYRYPLGCLGTTALKTAHGLPPPDRASPCWRYGVYVTAILHRVRGVWRLGLEAISASCPAVSLPPAVRVQLAVCRRPAGLSR